MKVTKELIEFKRSNLEIFEPYPLGHRKFRNNDRYLRLCFLLEENTNKIIFRGKKINILADRKMLWSYLKLREVRARQVFQLFEKENILLRFLFKAQEGYVMNPNLAFCGKAIPKYLIDLFKFNTSYAINDNNINIKGTKYEKIRKEN